MFIYLFQVTNAQSGELEVKEIIPREKLQIVPKEKLQLILDQFLTKKTTTKTNNNANNQIENTFQFKNNEIVNTESSSNNQLENVQVDDILLNEYENDIPNSDIESIDIDVCNDDEKLHKSDDTSFEQQIDLIESEIKSTIKKPKTLPKKAKSNGTKQFTCKECFKTFK